MNAMFDAPFANIPPTPTAVVHFCCLEEGVGVCWDEVVWEGVWKASTGSISCEPCPQK